jgi:3-methyladenine DNA glycosylase/8-oxoguanine DNA glycosylase
MTTPRARKLPYDADAARRHISRRDRVMRGVIRQVGPIELELRGAPYETLMRALLYQQLAGAAAAAIERRFHAIYGGRPPQPEELLATPEADLKAAGLSRQKLGYLRSLAEHCMNGGLTLRSLGRAPDDVVIERVTAIKGVGRWTADMLLMFCLGRPDVLPVGDLGVRRGVQVAYNLEDLPDPATMERIAKPWRPYRSAGAWYLWRVQDTVTL